MNGVRALQAACPYLNHEVHEQVIFGLPATFVGHAIF